MKNTFIRKTRSLIQRFGYDVIRYQAETSGKSPYPPDFDPQHIEICEMVRPYTMTSPERISALLDAIQYVVKNNIKGAFVECGVWKGGSAMAMALALQQLDVGDRALYLYDTFAGMSAPTDADVSLKGTRAGDKFQRLKIGDDSSDWCYSSLDEVKANVLKTGYCPEKVHFIQGKVEETIPAHLPPAIALLRLDTDWYESTKHELTHLFPLLSQHGVVIIDDYGHWVGAKKAVDEYIAQENLRILLNRIDYTGRIAVKV